MQTLKTEEKASTSTIKALRHHQNWLYINVAQDGVIFSQQQLNSTM
jgi:hypothetical protein